MLTTDCHGDVEPDFRAAVVAAPYPQVAADEHGALVHASEAHAAAGRLAVADPASVVAHAQRDRAVVGL